MRILRVLSMFQAWHVMGPTILGNLCCSEAILFTGACLIILECFSEWKKFADSGQSTRIATGVSDLLGKPSLLAFPVWFSDDVLQFAVRTAGAVISDRTVKNDSWQLSNFFIIATAQKHYFRFNIFLSIRIYVKLHKLVVIIQISLRA